MLNEANAATRRDFLLSTGVFAAGALLNGGEARAQQQAPKAQPAQPPQSEDAPATTAPQAIDPQVIAHAEQLAGIEFTHAEREMMSKTISEQLGFFKARLEHGFAPNTLAPALRFDPRLPSFSPSPPDQFLPAKRIVEADPATDEDIAFAPVTRLARWLQNRQISSVRLTEIYLARLKQYDTKLKCVITLCEAHAMKQAADADREIAAGRYRGPLHGVPWGAKDLFDTAGIASTWGAEPFRDRVPSADATVVSRLNDAGAVLVAKLSLGALAYNDIWFGGRTNNPWNLEQGSSGSSAGSAAATAAGLVGFAIGTETYGSITSPCMRCGTTGLRPTFGRVSRTGAMALCWSLDKIGPICRTVEDCASVLSAINGADSLDPSSIDMPFSFNPDRPIQDVRLGFDPKWFEGRGANDLDRAALEVAKDIGVKMVEIELPDWPYDALLSILLCEAAAAFEELTRTNQDDTLKWQEPQAWPNTFRQTWFIPGVELVQADRFRRECMQMMARVFNQVDALIGPSFAGSLCLLTNNTGHPSLTLRCGFRPSKRDDPTSTEVPHGITLIGRLFDEATICRVGMALEKELGVWDRRPSL